jgi:hypothetical protein
MFTAHSIFSVLERHYILEQSEYAASKSAEVDEEVVDQTVDPHYAGRPPRYKNVTLPANWYVVSKNKKKRGDHKCHGLISFKQLSKMIADAWVSSCSSAAAAAVNATYNTLTILTQYIEIILQSQFHTAGPSRRVHQGVLQNHLPV